MMFRPLAPFVTPCLLTPLSLAQLLYLIITVAIGAAPIPTIALALIGATYGLQVIIFLIKREFMLIGWLVLYLLAFVARAPSSYCRTLPFDADDGPPVTRSTRSSSRSTPSGAW